MSCSAMPRVTAYSRARSDRWPKISMQTRPTVDATRQQDLPQVVKRFVSTAIQIHLDAVDEIGKRLPRQVEVPNPRLKPPPWGVSGAPV